MTLGGGCPVAPAYSLPPVIHHVILETDDLERSAAFYDAMLAPLGWRRQYDKDGIIGWGIAQARLLRRFPQRAQARVRSVQLPRQRHRGGQGRVGGRSARRRHRHPRARRGPQPRLGPYSTFLKDPDGYDIEVTVGSP